MHEMNQKNQKKRAWLYCRIDAPEDLHGALKRQRQQLMDYAEQMAFKVVGSSQDLASGMNFDRPGLVRINEAAQARQLDVLIVSDVSRIGRDTIQTMDYLNQLEQMGVSAYSPLEGRLDFSLRYTVRSIGLQLESND